MDDYEDVNEGLGTAAPDVGAAIGVPAKQSASAAYRDRPAPLGRSPENISGYGPADVAMIAAPAPLGLAGRAAMAAPKTVASVLAALGLLGGASQAGEGNFKWEDPDKERSGRINQFEQTMNNLNKEMRAASKARMPSVQKQMDQLIKQHNELLTARQQERDAAFQAWQKQEGARMEAERPFREQYPTAYRMLPLLGWGSSALGGLLGAKAGKPIQSMIGGAIGGIPGSAAAAVGPTAYDAATLPTGSKHQTQAANWLADPNYWLTRVGPEVLTGMGLGAMGGKFGSYKPTGKKPMSQPAAEAPATPASGAPPAASPAAPASTPPVAASATAAAKPANPNQGLVYDPASRSWVRDPADPANAEWFRMYGQMLQNAQANSKKVRSVLQQSP